MTVGQLTLECLHAWLDLFQPGDDSFAITHVRGDMADRGTEMYTFMENIVDV